MGRGGHLPLRPRGHPRRGVLHRHAAADGVGIAAHGIGLRLRPDRRHRPLPPHAGVDALLPDGLGRQRAAHRTTGPERTSGSPATPRFPTTPTSRCPRAGQGRHPGQPAQLHRALPPAHGRGRAGLRGPVAARRALGRLGEDVRHHRRPQPANQPAHVPAQPGPRRGLLLRGADDVGRRLPDRGGPGGDGGPGAGRRLSPPAIRRHRDRDDPTRAGRRLRGPGGAPRRRALRRHGSGPRCARRSSASRCRCWPTSWPNPTRARASP